MGAVNYISRKPTDQWHAEVDGTVGIWHETYLIQPHQYEAVYGNMPVFGLAKATQHVPAVGRRETARRRLGGENAPAVATPEAIA